MAFPGKYDFTIHFDSNCLNKRNVNSTFSLRSNKLYVKEVKPCRIGFNFTASVPLDSVIRVFALYKAPELMLKRVVRCKKHIELNSDHHMFPEHFIRCDDPSACYLNEERTGVLSLSLPISSLTRARKGLCYLEFKFMCFSSCLLEHGAIDSVFNLMSGEELLGSCRVETRVCASPYRDFRKQEFLAKSLKRRKRRLPEVASPPTQLLSLSTSAISSGKKTISNLMNRWLEIGTISEDTDSSDSDTETVSSIMSQDFNSPGNRRLAPVHRLASPQCLRHLAPTLLTRAISRTHHRMGPLAWIPPTLCPLTFNIRPVYLAISTGN